MYILLRREGWNVGKDRFYRVYSEENLALRRKRPWRHVTAVHRLERQPAARANDVWGMDFVADQLADGRKIALSPLLMCSRASVLELKSVSVFALSTL